MKYGRRSNSIRVISFAFGFFVSSQQFEMVTSLTFFIIIYFHFDICCLFNPRDDLFIGFVCRVFKKKNVFLDSIINRCLINYF